MQRTRSHPVKERKQCCCLLVLKVEDFLFLPLWKDTFILAWSYAISDSDTPVPCCAVLFFDNSRHWILKATFPPNAKRKRVAAGTGGRERGNTERRVEGVRFRRSWGNFVSVLIDFGPFEILLPIKLTVCCAISTVVQTFLPFESFLPFF